MTDTTHKYCDLVMKGGITSGIVYPNAALALAKDYRFKNIGGTSAGAIAAAACAAAALGDRRTLAGQDMPHAVGKVGFNGLAAASRQLSTEGFIASLFQPVAGARSAYRALVVATGNSSAVAKMASMLAVPVLIAPLEMLATAAVLCGLAYLCAGWPGLAAAGLPMLICAYGVAAVAGLLRIARVARRNLIGLCSGLSAKTGKAASTPGLTEWLHQILQETAGLPMDEPLIFQHLWDAPRYPDEPTSAQAINLRMITTCISHHEPRSLPFDNSTFWFRRDEFAMLFPANVVAWMVAQSGPCRSVDGIDYYQLPSRGQMPVLVAMRMSLSFPLLISAVPLHEAEVRGPAPHLAATDPAVPATPLDSMDSLTSGGKSGRSDIRKFRPCWFSDGGISSNFPIHLFDAPLPRWPTFAINLVYPGTPDVGAGSAPPAPIALPQDNNRGWQTTYQSIARPGALGEISSFVGAILATMQNWRDLLQARAPGQRDRIVPVSLTSKEGGMNLNMRQKTLDAIAAKGTAAGLAFAEFSFANHHWIRWRNLASALQRYTIKVAEGMTGEPVEPGDAAIRETVLSGEPEPPSYKFSSDKRRQGAEALIAALIEQGADWKANGPDFTAGAPRPLPQMQITPIY